MTRLIDLGVASFETKASFPSLTQQDSAKLVENGIRYRAQATPMPVEPKTPDEL